jgi:hypothetical protein
MEYGKSSYWLMIKDLQTVRYASEMHSRWHRNYMNCHALSGVGVLYSPFRQMTCRGALKSENFAALFFGILSPFNTPAIVVKADTHVLKSHTKWWVSFVSDLSTTWRSWDTASSADRSTALEREAVVIRPPPNSSGSFCLSPAPPKPKTLALLALGPHSRSWYQI